MGAYALPFPLDDLCFHIVNLWLFIYCTIHTPGRRKHKANDKFILIMISALEDTNANKMVLAPDNLQTLLPLETVAGPRLSVL